MRKMARATDRAPFSITNKSGNVVITCSPTAYLALKVGFQHSMTASTEFKIEHLTHADRTGVNEHDIIKIRDTCGKTATINFYNTTTRIMINGCHSEVAINIVRELINSIRADVDIAGLDQKIRKVIEQWLSQKAEHSMKEIEPQIQPENKKADEDLALLDSIGHHPCSICNSVTSPDDAIFCNLSDHWLHLVCLKICNNQDLPDNSDFKAHKV